MVNMKKEKGAEYIKEQIKNADHSVNIGNGVIQHLKFTPSKEFADEEGVKLFGITVKQQGRKLIIIMKIYDEGRRKEIIDKSNMMTKIMSSVIEHDDIDKIHIVDSKDILDQISKHKIDGSKFAKDEKQKLDITIETIDLITGEMVSIEFAMGLVRIDKKKYANVEQK